MLLELEVYSNEQWRDCRKRNYVVKGDLASLKAFVLRWQARDRARDPEGMTVYHNFVLDPCEKLTDDDLEVIGRDAFYELDKLTRPWLYETCEHGLSSWLCEGPQHYPMDI